MLTFLWKYGSGKPAPPFTDAADGTGNGQIICLCYTSHGHASNARIRDFSCPGNGSGKREEWIEFPALFFFGEI